MPHESKNPKTTEGHVAERWYLRIDDRNYGPVGRAELERFLQPPRLCSVMEVKCGDDGVWFSIARHETIDKVLARVGVATDRGPETIWERPSPSSLSLFLGSLRNLASGGLAWAVDHWGLVAVVLGFVTINSVLLVMMRDPYGREREVLERYEALWKEVGRFDAGRTSPSEWRAFADRALAELEPILRELAGTASVQHPVRQNLLFAGRDQLQTILKAERPPAGDAPHAALFERRLKLARQQLPSDRTADSTPTTSRKGTGP